MKVAAPETKAKTPPAKTGADAAATAGNVNAANLFEAAMDKAEHPNLTPLNGDDAAPTLAQKALAAQAKLTGRTDKDKAKTFN
jgi:hypothetical protein